MVVSTPEVIMHEWRVVSLSPVPSNSGSHAPSLLGVLDVPPVPIVQGLAYAASNVFEQEVHMDPFEASWLQSFLLSSVGATLSICPALNREAAL